MKYGYVKEVPLTFEYVLGRLPGELRKRGFKILSSLQIDNELRRSLGVEFRRYTILGVSNLTLCYKALLREENFGLFFPSNIIVYEKEDKTVVATLRPTAFIPLIGNEHLHEGAVILEKKLYEVIESLTKRKFLKEAQKEESGRFARAVA